MQREEHPVLTTGLERIASKARSETKFQFTALAHHITRERVWGNLNRIPNKSAPGCDEQTVSEAKQDFNEWIDNRLQSVHCQDGKRKGYHQHTKFIFLGYEFRRRMVKGSKGKMFLSFTPAISKEAKKDINKTIRRTGVRNRSDLSLEQVARRLNPMLNGWIN